MDKQTQELLDRLRYTYADNGAAYNSDFTLTLQKAADLIEELTERLCDKVPDNQWLIRKEPNTKDKYYVAEGVPPDEVLKVYGIVKEKE